MRLYRCVLLCACVAVRQAAGAVCFGFPPFQADMKTHHAPTFSDSTASQYGYAAHARGDGDGGGAGQGVVQVLGQAAAHAVLLPARSRRPAVLSAFAALAVLVLVSALDIGVHRLMIEGEASFYAQSLLSDAGIGFVTLCLLWLGAEASAGYLPAHLSNSPEYRVRRLSSTFGMLLLATLPASLLFLAFEFLPYAVSAGWLPAQWLGFLRQYGLWVWMGLFAYWAAVLLRVLFTYFHSLRVALPCALSVVAFSLFAAFRLGYQHWYPVYDGAESEGQRLELSQATFEKQLDIFGDVLDIPAGTAGTPELFAIVYAPHANDGMVFLNESRLVAEVLDKRYGAGRRTVQLVNHASTTDSIAWATPTNLRRAIAVLAGKMNPEEDVLMVYATSHGGQNATLASSHWPLEVADLNATELAEMLDDYGIRYRVLIVSACYSGSWLDALENDTTLLMTAADAKNTSYGCGRLSDLTFFGRALFDEQLRTGQTLEQAFSAARPVIRQREEEAGKDDGFSNPQLRMGSRIRPVLQRLEAVHGRQAQAKNR